MVSALETRIRRLEKSLCPEEVDYTTWTNEELDAEIERLEAELKVQNTDLSPNK